MLTNIAGRFYSINSKKSFRPLHRRTMSSSSLKTPLILPASTDNPDAVVVFLHGLGDSGYGWEDAFQFIQKKLPNIKVILPHAPNQPVTLNMGMHMPSWYDIKGLDDRAQEDLKGIQASFDIVNSIVNEEVGCGIEQERIIIGGFSQGGALALYTSLTLSDKIGGIMGLSCYLPSRDKFDSKFESENKDTPLLMCHGDVDAVVRHEWGVKSFEVLKKHMTKTQFKTYKGMGHSANYEELEDMTKFIKSVYEKV